MIRSLIALIVFVALSFAAAIPGMFFKADAWYEQLAKPALTPPNWVFGVVWTFLFTLMSIAAWLVWRHGGLIENKSTLAFYVVQLAFNAGWTCIFFGLHQPALALAELVCLWLAILAALIAFWSRDTLAGILMMPYLAWVTFAGYLNWAFWRLNT